MASIKKNISFQLFYRVLSVITPLITVPVLSRALGAQGLGVFSGTLAYVSYFMLFTRLGVDHYGSRLIATVQNDPEKKAAAFWNAYAVQFSCFCIASTVYLITLFFLPPERRVYQALQGVWIVSSGLDITWLFFGSEEFGLTVKVNTVIKALTVAAIVLFVRTPQDLSKYILIMSGGELTYHALLWFKRGRLVRYRRPTFAEMKKHIRPMVMLFIPVMACSVYQIMDKTMLDLLSDETNLGYYYSADKVINIPLEAILAVGTVLLPRLSGMMGIAEKQEILQMEKKGVEITTCLASSVGFGIAAVAREFVPIMFGPGFEPCVELLYCFVPVLIAKAWNNAIRIQYLIPAHKDRAYIKATVAGALSNLVLNYFFIRRYAAIGAVIATLVAEVLVLVVEMFAARGEVPFGRFFLRNSVYLLLGGVMFLGVRALRRVLPLSGWPCLMVLICAGALLYLLLASAVWKLDRGSAFHGSLRGIVGRLRGLRGRG